MKIKLIFLIGLILFTLSIGVGCSPSPHPGLNKVLNTATKSYRFNILNWEVTSIIGKIKQSFQYRNVSVNDTGIVVDYFNGALQATLSPSEANKSRIKVENIIERQIRDVLSQNGIINPFGSIFGLSFPPLLFELTAPPHLLVISPRDQISRIKDILLLPDLSTDQMNTVVIQAEKSGDSALVVELGGLGATFPTFVNSNSSLHDVLNAAAEEWLHQYLAFKPLGFRYVLDLLGIARNEDIITMNESTAGIIGSEIGDQVYNKYYASYFPESNASSAGESPAPSFDFNAAMRQIRQNVDAYLADGQIDRAEQYMNEQRDYLQTQGYYIRKLNQAYFAFYGTYADTPAYTNPIGAAIQNIRDKSNSLNDFLKSLANVTSVKGLDRLENKLSK